MFIPHITRKALLSLPNRPWNQHSIYDSLLVIREGHKHDSGYALMAIIGMNGDTPIEIAAICDDINWHNVEGLRNDMYFPSGVLRFWCNNKRFEVGHSLSSTSVWMHLKVQETTITKPVF